MKRQAALVILSLALFLAACDLNLGIGSTAEPTATVPSAPPPLPPTPAAPAATATLPPTPVPTATVPPPVIATVVLLPTSTTVAPTAVPSTGVAVYVGNTGGIGVYVRKTTRPDDRVKAYPDNTRLDVIGPDVEAEGRTWKHVRAPDGIEGYVPAQYTVPELPTTATATPGPPTIAATPTPATTEPAATPATVPPTPGAATFLDATVARVVNGEVIEVAVPGETVRMRLIGIDAPEVVGAGELFQCFGLEASNRANELLAGQPVRLELDASQGERDAAGQLLAYAWLRDGSMYNARMIAEGYALEFTGGSAYRYQGQFKAAEQQARGQQVGLWQPGACGTPTPVQG